jgi:hypothetical protein
MNCKSCKQPLIEIEINHHFRVVCDNDRCKLFREGQGCIAKEIEAPEYPYYHLLSNFINPKREAIP